MYSIDLESPTTSSRSTSRDSEDALSDLSLDEQQSDYYFALVRSDVNTLSALLSIEANRQLPRQPVPQDFTVTSIDPLNTTGVEFPYEQGGTSLHYAAQKEDANVLLCLLDAHPSANKIWTNEWDLNGYTALHHAILAGHTEQVELLHQVGLASLNRGVKTQNTHDTRARTALLPLHLAAEYGRRDILAYLLDNNLGDDQFDINQKGISDDELGQHGARTALLSAFLAGHVDCVALLLKHGADPTLDFQQEIEAIDQMFQAVRTQIAEHERLADNQQIRDYLKLLSRLVVRKKKSVSAVRNNAQVMGALIQLKECHNLIMDCEPSNVPQEQQELVKSVGIQACNLFYAESLSFFTSQKMRDWALTITLVLAAAIVGAGVFATLVLLAGTATTSTIMTASMMSPQTLQLLTLLLSVFVGLVAAATASGLTYKLCSSRLFREQRAITQTQHTLENCLDANTAKQYG